MIEQSTFRAVVSLAENLSERGIQLGVVKDSPLAALLATLPVLPVDPAHISLNEAVHDIERLSHDEGHTEVTGEIKQVCVASLRRTLDTARNQIMPHINRCLDKINSHQYTLDVKGYNVKKIFLDDAYNHASVHELARQNEGTIEAPSGTVTLGSYTPDDILSKIKISDTDGLNEDLALLVTSDNNEGITQIQEVLSGQRAIRAINPEYALPLLLVGLAIKTPPEGLRMTLQTYESMRMSVVQYGARTTLKQIARTDHALSNNTLYVDTRRAVDGEIRVYGEVLNKLLSDESLNFTIDHVIGNEVLGRPYYGRDLLDPKHIEQMQAAYLRDKGFRDEERRLQQASFVQKAVLEVLRQDLESRFEDNTDILEGDDKGKAFQRLRHILDTVYRSELKRMPVDAIVTAAILGTWYAHDDASKYVMLMIELQQGDTTIPARELATKAAFYYITQWVGSMIGKQSSANVHGL